MTTRKQAVTAVPGDTLRVLAYDALLSYQALGLRAPGDRLFRALLARLPLLGHDAQ
jgi:hypothetical protein